MTFLETIFARLASAADDACAREVRDGKLSRSPARNCSSLVAQARAFLAARGLKKGDRCALLAPNSIRWVALDLALMAEGLIVVPLYARQAPPNLPAMMKDSRPARILLRGCRIVAEIAGDLAGRSCSRSLGCSFRWRAPTDCRSAGSTATPC